MADLLEAETELQRAQAFRVFSGEVLATGHRRWRARPRRARSPSCEATIDFADEEVPEDVWPEVHSLVSDVASQLGAQIAGMGAAERLRDGYEVAIVGPPNAGKSTLLNRLAGREVALTSTVAGTTRDVIEVRMDLGGLAVTLLDTAGIRESEDEVERLGVARARTRAEAADLRVHLVPDGASPVMPLRAGDISLVALADDGRPGGISGLTGAGVDTLLADIAEILGAQAAEAGAFTRHRHHVALANAEAALTRATGAIDRAEGAELIAADLWAAVDALDHLVGRVDMEHVLGEIFSSFCIGK